MASAGALFFLLASAAAIGDASSQGEGDCSCNGLTVENRGNEVVPYSGQCLS